MLRDKMLKILLQHNLPGADIEASFEGRISAGAKCLSPLSRLHAFAHDR
jgi:hypothetical protein